MRAIKTLTLAVLLALLTPLSARAQSDLTVEDLEASVSSLASDLRQKTVLIYGVIGLGSGAVISEDGHVVTNAHVVAGARYAVVQWSTGHTSLMERMGIDYERDLAVLQPVDRLDGPVAHFSINTADLAEGQWVVAIGFPGGLRGNSDATVSLGRLLPSGDNPMAVEGILNYSGALRSDTAIFSGNSGGPLVDLDGRLIGINGAVDLENAVSLTIPAELMVERTTALRGGVVRLPGGTTLDPSDNMILRGLYRILDPMAREMPQRIADMTRQMTEQESPAMPLDQLPDGLTPGPTSDRLANVARAKPRQEFLDAAWTVQGRAQALVLDGDIMATALPGGHFLVCKASRLGNREQVTIEGSGQLATRVAVSVADDLALLSLETALPGGAGIVPAPVRSVGSVVYAVGADGQSIASGIISVGPRRTLATIAASIQSGGTPAIVEQALEAAKGLAERFDVGPIMELVEQIQNSMEIRRAFSAGTDPRSYADVLSTDAPLAPSAMGAPVFDRQGRLVGMSVGVAHHGTTYIVPLRRIREAFVEQLGTHEDSRRGSGH
jgi:S1-C subfamily serine protease